MVRGEALLSNQLTGLIHGLSYGCFIIGPAYFISPIGRVNDDASSLSQGQLRPCLIIIRAYHFRWDYMYIPVWWVDDDAWGGAGEGLGQQGLCNDTVAGPVCGGSALVLGPVYQVRLCVHAVGQCEMRHNGSRVCKQHGRGARYACVCMQ